MGLPHCSAAPCVRTACEGCALDCSGCSGATPLALAPAPHHHTVTCHTSSSAHSPVPTSVFHADPGAVLAGPKLLALLVYMGGQLTETIALAFGNSAVLSACSASALVWNAMLANRLFKEQFTLVDATATSAICMGIIACAVTGPPSHDLTVTPSTLSHTAAD